MRDFAGSNGYVLDYPVEEVPHRQLEDLQAISLRKSILDRMTARLREAVTGHGGAAALA